jgi:CHAD domain-containing protein
VPLAPLELQLPAELDDAAVAELLAGRLDVQPGRSRSAQRVLLDTFDGRLRAAGLTAEHAGALSVTEPGAPARTAEVALGPRLLIDDLPAGPVRERLSDVVEERALLPLATVRTRTQPLAVLGGDAKTVVRMEIERAEGLPARLRVRPVLGYDADFSRVARVLTRELGLPEAGESLFDAAVRAAGGRPEGFSSKPAVELKPGTPAGRATGRVLARLADIAESNVPGTLEDLDTEFLHDLRVAVRRARSVVREMAAVLEPDARSRLREELRWVQQMSGPARDLDVQLLEWDRARTDLEPVRKLLERRRAAALRDLRRGLRSRRFAKALESWRALAAEPGATAPIETVAADRIRRVYRRMVRDGLAIDEQSPAESLHDLRKRGKELRYLLELFGGLFPGAVVKPMVASLKALQDVLGRFQDRAVQAELMRELGGELGDAPALMALGVLVEELEADQRLARDEFAGRFEAFAAKSQRKLVRATFPKRS